jgi:hypothetical protein
MSGEVFGSARVEEILTWRSNVSDDGMVEFVVASRVEDHDDGGVEYRGDDGSKITST